jgi:transcriptional regulator with XRE-family HTH domain
MSKPRIDSNETSNLRAFFSGALLIFKAQYRKIEGNVGKAFSFPQDGRVSSGEADPRWAQVSGGAFAMRAVHQTSRLAPNRRRGPGERLRALRLVLGMSLREVHQASIALSKRLRNSEFLLPASRLHEFETRSVVPSIHRLYTLASVYGYEITDLLGWYGIPQRAIPKRRAQPIVRS